MYQTAYQIDGTKAHEAVDNNTYSTKKKREIGIGVNLTKENL